MPEGIKTTERSAHDSDKRRMAHTRQEYLRDKTLGKISRGEGRKSTSESGSLRMQEFDRKRTSVARGQFLSDEVKIFKDRKSEQVVELEELKTRKAGEISAAAVSKPELGEDLESIRTDASVGIDYDFDQKNDRRNILSRGIVNKASGMMNYMKKHPGKAALKLVPVVPLAMNLIGTGKSISRSMGAGKEATEAETEAKQLMWKAHQKKNTKNAIKKGVASVVGGAMIGAGGGFDFGVGDAAGELGSSAVESLGPLMSAAIERSPELMASEIAETAAEEPLGDLGEDIAAHGVDALKKKSPLIKTGRKSRMEIMNPHGDHALAHKSLLAKDTKYGNAVRKSVRGTLAEHEVSGKGKKSDGSDLVDLSKQQDDPSISLPESDRPKVGDITAKQNMLSQLTQTARIQQHQGSDTTLNVGKVKRDQQHTAIARNQRLQKQMGYTERGHIIGKRNGKEIHRERPLSVTQAVEKDKKIDAFSEKSILEA